MKLAEWLVRRAPELISRVRPSARSSSMMHILHSCKNPSRICVALKTKKIATNPFLLFNLAVSTSWFRIMEFYCCKGHTLVTTQLVTQAFYLDDFFHRK